MSSRVKLSQFCDHAFIDSELCNLIRFAPPNGHKVIVIGVGVSHKLQVLVGWHVFNVVKRSSKNLGEKSCRDVQDAYPLCEPDEEERRLGPCYLAEGNGT